MKQPRLGRLPLPGLIIFVRLIKYWRDYIMGEVNEALGIGDSFVIDGKEYPAHIATFEDLEKIDKLTEGLFLNGSGIRFNFIRLDKEEDDKKRDDRIKRLFALLKIIFPDTPVASLKKLDRKMMALAVERFLLD